MSFNSKKQRFLASIPTASLDLPSDLITKRCKFNFAYFTEQAAGQSFKDWSGQNLVGLCEKLKEYSNEPLEHWMNTPIGKSGTILSIYGNFPTNSDFELPKHIPHQALWGRFRLDWSGRMIGFVIPKSYGDKLHQGGYRFDCNTFYIVFLDENHVFYKTGQAR